MADRKILDREKVMAAIEAVENLDLENSTEDEISQIIEPLFDGLATYIPYFNPPRYIYRGCVCPDKPKFLARINYPPIEFASIGRANKHGQSMFYGSIGLTIPIYEIRANDGDRLAIAVWKTTKRIDLEHIGFTKEATHRLGSVRNLSEIHNFVTQTVDIDELTSLIYNFLGNIFSQQVGDEQKAHYKLTSVIANRLLKNKKIDGIIYPTISMMGNADNIVLKPESVNGNLEFDYVQFIQIHKGKNNEMAFTILDSAVQADDNGEILWTGNGLSWDVGSKEEVGLRPNMDEWIAFDKNGLRIKPQANMNLYENASPLLTRFLTDFADCHKGGRDLDFTSSSGSGIVKFSLIIDFKQSVKFVAIYLPDIPDPLGVLIGLLNNLEIQIEFFDDFKVELFVGSEGNRMISSDQVLFNSKVYVYSENWFNRHILSSSIPKSLIGHLVFASHL